eukprot:g2345.t1
MSLKRKLHEALDEQDNDMDDPSALLAGVGIGERGSTIVKKLLEFLDDLDDDGFDALNDFQSKNWRHFLPKSLGGTESMPMKRTSTDMLLKCSPITSSSAPTPLVAPALFSFSVGSDKRGESTEGTQSACASNSMG